MTVANEGNGNYRGLNSDTKPTKPAGYTFFETDTGDRHISDGTYWWLYSKGPFSSRRFGYRQWGVSTTVGTGMLSSVSAGTGTAAQGFSFGDTTNGYYLSCPTGTTVGNKSGFRTNGALVIRSWNPRMSFKFMLPAATDYTLSRLYLGFAVSGEPTGDDPFNATRAFMVGFTSANPATNFKILRNDSNSATDTSGDVAGSAQAVDTAIHDVKIVADEANTRFSIKWDANAYQHFTTEIPASTVTMAVILQNETNESGVAKTIRVYDLYVQSDK